MRPKKRPMSCLQSVRRENVIRIQHWICGLGELKGAVQGGNCQCILHAWWPKSVLVVYGNVVMRCEVPVRLSISGVYKSLAFGVELMLGPSVAGFIPALSIHQSRLGILG